MVLVYVCNGFFHQIRLGSYQLALPVPGILKLCNYLQNVGAKTYIFGLQLSTFLFYNKQKSNMSMTQEKMYMNVDDVCAVLGVSKAFAYKIMKGYNEELKERGFLVIPGKISTKFLAEKIYGMKVEE